MARKEGKGKSLVKSEPKCIAMVKLVKFGGHFLPENCLENPSLAESATLETVLTGIFDVGAEYGIDVADVILSTGASVSGIGIVLLKIKKKIESLEKDLEQLMNAHLETAKDGLEKGLNYMQFKNYKKAYNEFGHVLSNASLAYNTVKSFEGKVLCKKISIFSRMIKDTYDEATEEFLPLSEVPENLHNSITQNIFHDLNQVTEAFDKLELPYFYKAAAKSKNQDILDTLLKTCLPMIWHSLDIFKESKGDDMMLKYIPEGRGDAALVNLDNSTSIYIWKEMSDENNFSLRWDYETSISSYDKETFFELDLQNDPLLSPFKSLTSETCHFLRNGLLDQDCLVGKEIKDSYNIDFVKEGDTVKAKYIGKFEEMSHNEIKEWTELPKWIKLLCTDVSYKILAHVVCKKGFTDLIPEFLTPENAHQETTFYKKTPLHYAVETNDLECVKMSVKCGGIVKSQDWRFRSPSEMSNDPEIQEYLSSVSLGDSSTFYC